MKKAFGSSGNQAIDVIGMPIDLGVKELGLKLGPDGLREAGLMMACRRVGVDVRDLGNVEMPRPMPPDPHGKDQPEAVARWCTAVGQMVEGTVRAGRIAVCIGGDHSMAIGSVAGAAAAGGPLGCIYMDAHPDANTPETSPSGNLHGMPVAILLGHGHQVAVDVGFPGAKLQYHHVALLGTRDTDPGEGAFIREHGVPMFTVFDVLEQGLRQVVDKVVAAASDGTAGVHVSLDLDVLREDIAPGVGLPSRSGFDMREAAYVCHRIAAECRVVSIDVVGLNPVRDREMMTARRAIELLMALLGKDYSFSYADYLEDQAK